MKKESNILNKILDYKNWTFKLNWSSGTVLVSLITGCLYLYNENKTLKSQLEDIPLLKETINTLNNSVSGLKSSNETFNNVIQSFMLNPPSSLQRQIDDIRIDINKYHNISNINTNNSQSDTSNFIGNKPPQF